MDRVADVTRSRFKALPVIDGLDPSAVAAGHARPRETVAPERVGGRDLQGFCGTE